MYHVDFVRFCFRDDLETWVTLDKHIKLMSQQKKEKTQEKHGSVGGYILCINEKTR